MKKELGGKMVDVNDEGFLTDFSQWNNEVAEAVAQEEGIKLTDEHLKVLKYLQDQYQKEVPMTIRKVGHSGIVDIKTLYSLFPGGPLKKASKIAGVPKPVSCI